MQDSGAQLGLSLLLDPGRLLHGAGAQPARRARRAGKLSRLSAQHRRQRARAGISSRSTACWARPSWRSGSRRACPAIAAWGRCASATRPMSRSSTTPMARSCCATSRPSSTSACSASAGIEDFDGAGSDRRTGLGASRPARRRAVGAAHAAERSTPIRRRCAGRRATGWPMPPHELGLPERRELLAGSRRRDPRHRDRAWPGAPTPSGISATFAGDDLDASLIQLLDLRFLEPDDPRFRATLAALETGLRRGIDMLRYATEDDFGPPETAFNVCTFWLIEALHLTGPSRGRARIVRGNAGPPHRRWPAVRRYRSRHGRTYGAIIRRPIRWSA